MSTFRDIFLPESPLTLMLMEGAGKHSPRKEDKWKSFRELAETVLRDDQGIKLVGGLQHVIVGFDSGRTLHYQPTLNGFLKPQLLLFSEIRLKTVVYVDPYEIRVTDHQADLPDRHL